MKSFEEINTNEIMCICKWAGPEEFLFNCNVL